MDPLLTTERFLAIARNDSSRTASQDMLTDYTLVNNPELGRTLRGFGDVKKLRVQNSDVERGKSGGYRLIYLVDAAGQRIIPPPLYSKSQKKDVSRKELKALLAGLAQDLNN